MEHCNQSPEVKKVSDNATDSSNSNKIVCAKSMKKLVKHLVWKMLTVKRNEHICLTFIMLSSIKCITAKSALRHGLSRVKISQNKLIIFARGVL